MYLAKFCDSAQNMRFLNLEFRSTKCTSNTFMANDTITLPHIYHCNIKKRMDMFIKFNSAHFPSFK